MNQEKIGKFIAKLRKERCLTQEELAEQLNVTNKSVSNWENGKNMPDVSLFKELCSILGISVNELINGEKINIKDINKYNETTLNIMSNNELNKKKFNKRIKVLIGIIILMLILVIILLISHNNIYPKFDIYSFIINPTDPDKKQLLNKKYKYKLNNKEYDIYYYGIDNAQLCDGKENCYSIKQALDYKQTDIDSIRKHFESLYQYQSIEINRLYDGGTTIYTTSGYQVIMCNTASGNKDIYIGTPNMVENLSGMYCGHSLNTDKSFTRTYKIISSRISSDPEFNEIVLEASDKEKGKVLINNSYDLVPGKTYYFSFYTFDMYKDTIENIFNNSILLKTVELEEGQDFINEKIYVNEENDNGSELNEAKHVRMDIVDGTLTRTGATIRITDYTKGKYTYGEPYRIDKYENNKWVKLDCNDCTFNLPAYYPYINGHLEFKLDWKHMYGSLKKGKYRIVKEALEGEIDNIKTYYFSVEFTIE